MKLQSSKVMMFVLMGILFLSISSVYAETAKDHYTSGWYFYITSDYTQAISEFTKAIEINPNYADAYDSRANAYYKSKEYDKAWADVHKAEELGTKIDFRFLEDLKKDSGRDK